MEVQIPDKLYFKIGEVAEFAGVKPHVLRYWETEFSSFRPTKSRSNQRLYTRKNLEMAIHLKDLLHNQGFTIAGARKKLREESRQKSVKASVPTSVESDDQLLLPLVPGYDSRLLNEIINDIRILRDSLDKPLSEDNS